MSLDSGHSALQPGQVQAKRDGGPPGDNRTHGVNSASGALHNRTRPGFTLRSQTGPWLGEQVRASLSKTLIMRTKDSNSHWMTSVTSSLWSRRSTNPACHRSLESRKSVLVSTFSSAMVLIYTFTIAHLDLRICSMLYFSTFQFICIAAEMILKWILNKFHNVIIMSNIMIFPNLSKTANWVIKSNRILFI